MSNETVFLDQVDISDLNVNDNGSSDNAFVRDLHKRHILGKLGEIERPGIDGLINFLENESDFFTAPASTKYHSNYEGGLAAHSIEVFELLKDKNIKFGLELPEETLIITGLMKSVLKGKKLVQKNKKDEFGKWIQVEELVNDWQEEEAYVIKDVFPVGHSEKSVIQLMKYIDLNDIEIAMIRWHMGFTEPQELHRTLNNAIELYPAIIALHTADLEASYFLEERVENNGQKTVASGT